MSGTSTSANGYRTIVGKLRSIASGSGSGGVRPLAGVLLLAAVLRLAFLLPSIGNSDRLYTADATEYVRLGQGFTTAYVDGEGPLVDESIRRPPGYPAFLALSFGILGPPSALSILPLLAISIATVGLVYLVARRMFGRRAAFWAGLLLAVDPVSIAYSSHFQPETLFAFLLIAGCAIWWSATRGTSVWSATAAGGFIALATFARPISLYLPILLVPVGLILGRAMLRRALALQLVFLLAFAVPIGAWTMRNRAVAGVTMFTSIQASSLFYQRAVAAIAREKGITWEEAFREFAAPQLNDPAAAQSDPAGESGNLARVGFRLLLQHPVGLAKIAARGMTATLAGPGRDPLLARVGESDPESPGGAGWALVGVAFALLGLIYAGVAVGLVVVVRRRLWSSAAVLLAMLAYLLIVSAGPEAYARFRLPMMPAFAMLGGLGWCVAMKFLRRHGGPRAPEPQQQPAEPDEEKHVSAGTTAILSP